MRVMSATTKQPPKPRATIEVEAAWLERPPPPLPPQREPARPPPLAANSARHHTVPVEAQWLEGTELDAKLRASLAPLPPPDERTRARMSSPIPREDPDDEPPADPSAAAESKPRRSKAPPRTTKRTVKKPSSKR